MKFLLYYTPPRSLCQHNAAATGSVFFYCFLLNLKEFPQGGKGLSNFPAEALDLLAGRDAVGNHDRPKARAVDADYSVGAVLDSGAKIRLHAKLAGGL